MPLHQTGAQVETGSARHVRAQQLSGCPDDAHAVGGDQIGPGNRLTEPGGVRGTRSALHDEFRVERDHGTPLSRPGDPAAEQVQGGLQRDGIERVAEQLQAG